MRRLTRSTAASATVPSRATLSTRYAEPDAPTRYATPGYDGGAIFSEVTARGSWGS